MKTARAMLVLSLLLAGASPPSASDEEVYRTRLATFLHDPGNYTYDSMEPLPGVETFRPLPTGKPAIAPAAIDSAIAYAKANRSSALIVWHEGRVVAEWHAPGADAATPLLSKSLSKPLTAIAVGRAIQLGLVRSLDQPISDWLPEVAGTQKGRIRLRHLLDMRSGMLDQGFSPDPEHPLNRCFLGTDHGRCIVDRYPMIAEPGTRYSYANAPSDLVALVLERATKRRFADFVGTEVFRPLGARGGSIWVDRPGGLAHSGCCAYLPADTFLRMAVLLLEDGTWHGRRLLPRGYVAEMRKGTLQNPSFGLGVWLGEPYRQRRGFGAPGTLGPQVLHSEPYLDPAMFLFDGNANQTVHISPRHRLVVLRMGATPPASPEWDNAYLPNTLIRGLPAD